jgi:hypothetical protein
MLPTLFRQHFLEVLLTFFLVNIFRKCCQQFSRIVGNIFSSTFFGSVGFVNIFLKMLDN